MYGEGKVHNGSIYIDTDKEPCVYVDKKYPSDSVVFNPYTSAEDSQSVQEFFELNTFYEFDYWRCESLLSLTIIVTYNRDLKIAIADCAYEVVKKE